MKVLIADDDGDQLTLRAMLLEACGFETLAAEDCQRALELVSEHDPACAVVDLRMPTEQEGLDLIRCLRASHPAMHIFVLTGGERAHLAPLLQSGAVNEIFPKGASAPELITKLRELAQGET